jgi:hypothetical protein
MRYPFLENNELCLIDFVPGSSGQLLMRLWAELDATMHYENEKVLTTDTITSHLASREIDYNIQIPKRITNWFFDRVKPDTVQDYVQFFEFLGTFLIADSQKWIRGSNSKKFYEDTEYEMQNIRVLYGIHSWKHAVPYKEMQQLGYHIKCISIVALTDRGRQYQNSRFQACYPHPDEVMRDYFNNFNTKPNMISFDLCTLLVDNDTDTIVNWLRTQLGNEFREEKVAYATHILNTYYTEVINNVSPVSN